MQPLRVARACNAPVAQLTAVRSTNREGVARAKMPQFWKQPSPLQTGMQAPGRPNRRSSDEARRERLQSGARNSAPKEAPGFAIPRNKSPARPRRSQYRGPLLTMNSERASTRTPAGNELHRVGVPDMGARAAHLGWRSSNRA